MKKLLLLLFIPILSFSQTYKDVMSIGSVDMFMKVAIEKEKKYKLPVENGIISFRNLSIGALKTKFLDKSTIVTPEKLENYKKGLERLITEILDKNTSFKEKKIEKSNRY